MEIVVEVGLNRIMPHIGTNTRQRTPPPVIGARAKSLTNKQLQAAAMLYTRHVLASLLVLPAINSNVRHALDDFELVSQRVPAEGIA